MYCTKCGKEIDHDTKFCPFCGSAQEQPALVHTQQPAQTQNKAGENLSTLKSNSTFKALIAVVAVFFIALIVFLGIVSKKLKSDATSEQEVMAASESETEKDIEEKNEPFASGIQVGDIVTFGSYEQDGRLSNGMEPVEWDVLDEQNGRYLLISHYVLDGQQFDDGRTDKSLRANEDISSTFVTWETCSLRKWLNDEFYNTAFSDTEKQYIVEVTNSSRDYDELDRDDIHNIKPSYKDGVFDTNLDDLEDMVTGIAGNPTQDRVFILDFDEFAEYYDLESTGHFYIAPSSTVSPTQYAVDQGINGIPLNDYRVSEDLFDRVHQDYLDNGTICEWILRSPGRGGGYAIEVLPFLGYECLEHWANVTNYYGIRPAIWVTY